MKAGLWTWVMASSGYRCARCGAPAESVHHRLKKSRGGRLIEDTFNCVPLCGSGTTGCHGEVEATNEHPWVIPGYVMTDKATGRPVYTGPDQEYRSRYPRS